MAEKLLQNEEDVRQKSVVQYLRSLGFTDDELHFETWFAIRLGHKTYEVGTKKKRRRAGGRSDILITRNGSNLAIVEVKKEGKELTSDDRDQAISYALLLNPPAPLAIVTNGKKWRGYHTLTRDDVAREDWVNQSGLTLSFPEELVYEALQNFVGYCPENLLAFCGLHTSDYMAVVRGEDKSYQPQTYVPFPAEMVPFQQFSASDHRALVLTGEAGRGKTSWLCNTAEGLQAREEPVLFFRAKDLRRGFFETLASDLNLTLSDNYSREQAVKRFFAVIQRKVWILVDSLDRVEPREASALVDEILRRSQEFELRFVATCRTSFWPYLLRTDDGQTRLSEVVFGMSGDKGCPIPQLSTDHVREVARRHREHTRYQGAISPRTLDESRRFPYLLRLAFAFGKRTGLPEVGLESKALVEQYLEGILTDFDRDSALAKTVIIELAKEMLCHGSPSVSLTALSARCSTGVHGIVARFVEKGVLETDSSSPTPSYSFYFDWVGEFVTAFWAKDWGKLSAKELAQELLSSSDDPRMMALITSYMYLAGAARMKKLAGEIWEAGESLAQSYEKLLDDTFPGIKSSFSPRTEGKIGFVATVNTEFSRVLAVGFRPISNDDDRVLLMPSARFPHDADMAFHMGVDLLRWGGRTDKFALGIPDAQQVLVEDIRPQLWKTIENGRLNESQCPHLLSEYADHVLRREFSDALTDTIGRAWKDRRRFSVAEMEKAILYRRAARIYEEDRVRELKESGEIVVHRHGSLESYTVALSPEERSAIRSRALGATANVGLLEEWPRVEPHHTMEKLLLSASGQIRDAGGTTVGPVLASRNYWNTDLHRLPREMTPDEHEETAATLAHFYQLFLKEYLSLLATSLPTMAQDFSLVAKMPVLVAVSITKTGGLREQICSLPSDHQNTVQVRCVPDFSNDVGNPMILELEGRSYECSVCYTSIRYMLDCKHKYIDSDLSPSSLPLRAMVYARVQKELPAAFAAFVRRQGIRITEEDMRGWS